MEKKEREADFLVVGVGASAGGLGALKGFLSSIPTDRNPELAYVVVQHLDPDHDSFLGSLLQKVTEMKVREIEDGMDIEPGCVYHNPPRKKVRIRGQKFRTHDFDPEEVPKLSIDYFFRSLAEELEERAVSVVLSGTGADGSTGLGAVKGAGGMTIAQEEDQAEYRGMPHNAIQTGLVDYVLPVEDMPARIFDYARHPYTGAPEESEVEVKGFQDTVPRIFSLIRSETGHDFSNYKKSTIRRRLGRRLAVHHIDNLEEYYKYLKENDKEIEKLFEDLLITVSNFFREPEVFEFIKNEILTELVERKPSDESLRVWVPGCSTGEEAYTVGILLAEIMEEERSLQDVQIFATDLNGKSIKTARQGFYPESIAADLTDVRLERFFEEEGSGYRVTSRIRKMVVFAEHDLVEDPPLSGMDLVSCRNVLIYMNQELHEKVLSLFHYALNEGGYLLLGTSESISGFDDQFEPVDKNKGVFKRKEYSRALGNESWGFSISGKRDFQSNPDQTDQLKNQDLKEIARRTILSEYSHPGVLIDEGYSIRYFHGNTEKYLAPPEGRPEMSVLTMARGSLKYKLTAAVQKAVNQDEKVVEEDVKVTFEGEESSIDLVVEPLAEGEKDSRLFMVVFRELGKTKTGESVEETDEELDEVSDEPVSERVMELQSELKSAKQSLRTTIKELETSNEELKSRNEELQATNEELRSTNEELKTAKEEAQSTNEELSSVNQELEEKIDELSKAKDDLKNLLDSTEIVIVFLDTELRIRRFTPEATKVFNLIDSDLGRPITDLSHKFNYEDLEEDLNSVMDTLQKTSKEIQTSEGDWYNVEIKPYRTTENVVDGLVVTCKDITTIKRRRLRKLRRLATVVEDSNDAIMVLDLKGDIQEWNRGAEEIYGYSEEEAKGMNILNIVPEKSEEKTLGLLEEIKSAGEVDSLWTKRVTKDDRVLDVWLTATRLMDESENVYAVATTERDISELKEKEESYEKKSTEVEARLRDVDEIDEPEESEK